MSTAVKLSKLLITRYKDKLFAISYDGNVANEIEYIENNSLLGSIHIGRVKKISKNINAAFVEIEYNKERQTVYFDMPDVKYIIFADEKEHTALHEGDDIVIKISKLPIKNKLAGATANISGVSTEVFDNIKARKNYIKSPSMLYAGECDYIEVIKDRLKYTAFDIVTDIKEVYEKIKDLNLDFAYIALHGVFGEDGRIQAILQSFGIAYSGPGVMSSAVCMDKEFSKRIVSEYGVRIAKWKSVRVGETVDFETVKKELGDHLIVKPNNGGSSIGVSFVETEEELKKGLELVFGMDKEALIEEVLHGVEISVPVIGGKVFPTIRIEALAGDYFDYESKYAKGGAKEYVFEFPEKVQAEINKFAQDSYYGLKCEGFARIDFMVVNEETPYFMEVNTSPGMTAASLLPKSTASKGYSYSETLDLLIESSLKVER